MKLIESPPTSKWRRRARCCALGIIAAAAFGCDRSGEQADDAGPQAQRAPDPQAITAALDAARQYFDSREIDKAHAILTELIAQAPEEADAQELLARVIFYRARDGQLRGDDDAAQELYKDAYARYRRVTELRPDVAGLHQNAGEFALIAQRADDALAHFRTAAALDRTNPKHPLYEAQVLLQLEDVASAREAIDRALALDPGEPYALATLAAVLMEEERPELALERIREAQTAAATREEARRFRVLEAKFLRQSDCPEEALQLLLTLDAESRTNEGVTAEIALSQAALGRHDRAVEAWAERFARTGDWRAAAEAGEAALRGGSIDLAATWLAEARLHAPADAPRLRALAEAIRLVARDEE